MNKFLLILLVLVSLTNLGLIHYYVKKINYMEETYANIKKSDEDRIQNLAYIIKISNADWRECINKRKS